MRHESTPKLCECGCGQAVLKKGSRYRHGHNRRRPLQDLYVVEDRGYETPCWIWQGLTIKGGYGRFMREGVESTAHRVFFLLAGGQCADDEQVDHLCRVRLCVNPDHLEAVSQVENIRRSRSAKLTLEQVEEIRAEHRALRAASPRNRLPDGARARMAEHYGISQYHLIDIANGKFWVPDPWLEEAA